MKFNKKLIIFSLLSLSTAMFYGFSLVNSWHALGYILICVQFGLFLFSFQINYRWRMVIIFASQFVFILATCWWFRNVDALGWSKIGGLSPHFWLMLAISAVALICAVSVLPIFWILYKIIDKWKLNNSFLTVYLWATALLLAEVVRSTMFSAIVHDNGMTIAPTWNVFSAALITSTNIFGYLGRSFGFWGTSFVIYFSAGYLVYLVYCLKQKKYSLSGLLAVVGFILTGLIYGSTTFTTSATETNTYNLVAVNQKSSEPEYLKRLSDSNKFNGEDVTIVALPEYSNLVHPLANSGFISFNYDARYDFPGKYKDSNVLFVGTEDEYYNGKRYAESYIANGELLKIDRDVKQFLIPGGEYVPGWISRVLKVVDKQAVQLFAEGRERNVIHDDLQNDIESPLARQIANGACSDLLAPYHFRNGVSDGALVLANSVSYEQFKRATEYESFARRFASFTTRSLERPMAIGSRDGAAMILNENGVIVRETNDGQVDSKVAVKNSKNLYVILGDGLIVLMIISLPVIVVFFGCLYKRLKKLRK